MDWSVVKRNSTLFPGAVSEEEGDRLKWHSDANSLHSSQVFCISAFGALRRFRNHDQIIAQVLSDSFPSMKAVLAPVQWHIELEYERKELLGEYGTPQPTSIDVLLTSGEAVFCVESKFKTDADKGFGPCGQASNGKCTGHYGPGSDIERATKAWCRLENWDKTRSPRLYWALGKAFFRPEVFQQENFGKRCPFADSNYQLVRNFLFAAALSERTGKPFFGVLTICPRTRAQRVEEQINAFRQMILLPEYAERIAVTYYEQYITYLRQSGDGSADELAGFLADRIKDLIDGTTEKE
jgi:hypothetical protein